MDTLPVSGSLDLLACPKCHRPLSAEGDPIQCTGCGNAYPRRDGFIDFAPEIETPASYGQAVMESRAYVTIYESVVRPNFVRVMSRNWGQAFTDADEEAYLARFLDPQDGHILDVACGTGRWTRAIAERFGPDRTIGFDLSFAMLRASRAALPGVSFVRGTAEKLPFADGSLGAINCWAALQLVPNPEAALAESARCLRPGGTWTCFTFRESEDPIYRYFQATHAPGLPSFTDEQIRAWVSRHGMEVVDLSGPELALFVTARRR